MSANTNNIKLLQERADQINTAIRDLEKWVAELGDEEIVTLSSVERVTGFNVYSEFLKRLADDPAETLFWVKAVISAAVTRKNRHKRAKSELGSLKYKLERAILEVPLPADIDIVAGKAEFLLSRYTEETPPSARITLHLIEPKLRR